MAYKIYRRMMRKVARFILSFDNCPTGCRRNFKSEVAKVANAFLLCALATTILGILIILS